MGLTWGPTGSCRPQIGPMSAPSTLLSGMIPAQAKCADVCFGVIVCTVCTRNCRMRCHWRQSRKSQSCVGLKVVNWYKKVIMWLLNCVHMTSKYAEAELARFVGLLDSSMPLLCSSEVTPLKSGWSLIARFMGSHVGGRQDPDGPHVDRVNLAIWGGTQWLALDFRLRANYPIAIWCMNE